MWYLWYVRSEAQSVLSTQNMIEAKEWIVFAKCLCEDNVLRYLWTLDYYFYLVWVVFNTIFDEQKKSNEGWKGT